MSDSAAAVTGLLSLSLVAAGASPIAVRPEQSHDSTFAPGSFKGPSSLTVGGTKAHPLHKHRRLSSTGQARRRQSDAREAASRPSAVTIQTAAAALSSLATLSLSGTPPPPTLSFVNVSGTTHAAASKPIPIANSTVEAGSQADGPDGPRESAEMHAAGINVMNFKGKGGNGKKRGTIFKCESCSKVYRHPSCLIKHRWEHSPHWREASKFLLSKHQQVQMLEAAAILSHLSPSASGGTSLPEDRSLWPSYLSGGVLPPPSMANQKRDAVALTAVASGVSQPVSSSVPASSAIMSAHSPSAGGRPRLYDYAVAGSGGVTHIRPGLLGVPTGSDGGRTPPTGPSLSLADSGDAPRSIPVPVPIAHAYREPEGGHSFASNASVSDAWSSPVSLGFAQSSFHSSSVSALGTSFSDSAGAGGWSLPRSSLRSASGSGSLSRSPSISEGDFVDVGGEEAAKLYGFAARESRRASMGQEKIEEEWDGMEMEMEM